MTLLFHFSNHKVKQSQNLFVNLQISDPKVAQNFKSTTKLQTPKKFMFVELFQNENGVPCTKYRCLPNAKSDLRVVRLETGSYIGERPR